MAIRSGDEALDRGLRGPSKEVSLLAQAGLLTAPLPVALGGAGWGTSPNGAVAMLDTLLKLGGASLPIARLYEGHVNAIKLMVASGTMDQCARVARVVADGALLGVWGADSETPVMIDTADREPKLTGTKAFASGVSDVGMAIVTAKSGEAIFMVLVDGHETRRCHPDLWDVDAMVGSRSGRFDCAGLPAGPQYRLGGPNALFVEPDFHGGLWRLAACYAGALDRIARLVADLIEARGQTSAQPMRGRLGLLAIEAETALLWATNACLAVEGRDTPSERAVRSALFAREAIEQGAGRALSIAERVAGTAMHRRASELGRVTRDLRFYLRQADLDGKLSLATEYWMHDEPLN